MEVIHRIKESSEEVVSRIPIANDSKISRR